MKWTAEKIETAVKMRHYNHRLREIGIAVGATAYQVAGALRRERQKRIPPFVPHVVEPRPVTPLELFADRDRRLLAPKSLTAIICGDPPIGQRALDRQ